MSTLLPRSILFPLSIKLRRRYIFALLDAFVNRLRKIYIIYNATARTNSPLDNTPYGCYALFFCLLLLMFDKHFPGSRANSAHCPHYCTNVDVCKKFDLPILCVEQIKKPRLIYSISACLLVLLAQRWGILGGERKNVNNLLTEHTIWCTM